MNSAFEQTLIEVWRQSLGESAQVFELDKALPRPSDLKRGLRQVDFRQFQLAQGEVNGSHREQAADAANF